MCGGVESWVRRNKDLRTPPGPEGSNGKWAPLCAVGVPGLSHGVSSAWGRGSIRGARPRMCKMVLIAPSFRTRDVLDLLLLSRAGKG
jgi:hypothetical protein